jgi:phosphinothricin acetyltransferase
MVIRPATRDDVTAITEIYNNVLVSSTAIYRDIPVTLDERLAWFDAQQEKGFAVFVASQDERVLGYASYSDFRSWPGYRFTVEASIHLSPNARHQGTGTLLFQALIDHARAAGKHMLIAGTDSENLASIRFLEKFGAERACTLREVGYKFGRHLDLVFFQIPLAR